MKAIAILLALFVGMPLIAAPNASAEYGTTAKTAKHSKKNKRTPASVSKKKSKKKKKKKPSGAQQQ